MRNPRIALILFTIILSYMFPKHCLGDASDERRQDLRRRRFEQVSQDQTTRPSPLPQGPWLGINLKDTPQDWTTQGALINTVAPGSPADRAGMAQGDIITSVNGRPVRNASDVSSAISGLTAGTVCNLNVSRGNTAFSVDVILSNRMDSSGDAYPVERTSDINVLEYAAIDPISRTVILLGWYDANYKTGPIQYYDLLANALKNPYPWFSLEPTQDTRNGVAKVHSAIAADIQRMYSTPGYAEEWGTRLTNLVLNDADMKADRARFLRKGAQAFGISEDEMLVVLQKSSGDSSVTTDAIMPILGKMLLSLGYDTLGQALIHQDEGPIATFTRLGLYEQVSPIIDAFHAGSISEEKATIQITVMMVSAILRELRVPETEIAQRAKAVLNGRMSLDVFMQFMEQSLMNIIVDSAGLKMFNGLTLSSRLMGKLYNIPEPQMNLLFRDVPADSLLGDVMFRADYALKSICSNPDTALSIPGFLTEMDYLYETSRDMGVRVPSDAGAEVGHMLVPGNVKMRVSPEGTLVSFDAAEVIITGWIINTVGTAGNSTVAGVLKNATEGYADYLTQRYDDLARVYPELHKLRETQKLIALVRWAKSNGYSIVVDRAAGLRMAQAPTATGFWQGVFTADAQEFSLTVMTQGGASFDEEQGEQWVQPEVDTQVTNNVLEQLAYSNAFAQEAADAAVSGDMEEARTLAEKSAQAMTGQLDFSQLPVLALPMPSDPAQAAALTAEVRDVAGQNINAIANAEIYMQKAADMEPTAPADAEQLMQLAARQKEQAERNLKALSDALEVAGSNPGRAGEVIVTVRSLNARPINAAIPAGNSSAGNNAPAVTSTQPPAATPGKSRAELLAELNQLENHMQSAKIQLARLNWNITQNAQQYSDWQKEAESGMDKCRDVLFGLFMDASANKLADRYETMYDLAKKLPDQPQPLIKRLGRTNELFTGLKDVKSFKDVLDWAYANGDTLSETLEKLRDGIGLISGLKGWDKTLVGAAWTYGSNIVDLTYSFTQYSLSYDAISQLDKNREEFDKQLASLIAQMERMKTRTDEIKQQLVNFPEDDKLD